MRIIDLALKRPAWLALTIAAVGAAVGYLLWTAFVNIPYCVDFGRALSSEHWGVLPADKIGDDVSRTHTLSGPSWTSDGRSIVFVSSRRLGPELPIQSKIYVASSDGSDLISVAGQGKYVIDHSPSVSPDDSRIAYSTYNYRNEDRRYFEIATSSLDGTDKRWLTRKQGLDFSPEWSPSGSHVAFMRYQISKCRFGIFPHNPAGIHVIEADGSGERRIVPFRSRDGRYIDDERDVRYLSGPSWSPDGQLIAYMVLEREWERDGEAGPFRSSTISSLYIAEADGSGVTRLAAFPLEAGDAITTPVAWSPDGQHIAFRARVDGGQTLYTISRNGSDLRDVTVPGIGRRPSTLGSVHWSPDGLQILSSIDGLLHVANMVGSELAVVGVGYRGAWSPDGLNIVSVDSSASGSSELYVLALDGTGERILVIGDDGVPVAVVPEQRPSADIASCSAGVVVSDPEANPGLVKDCESLVGILNRMAVAAVNWNAGTPIEEWYGVTLDDSLQDDPSAGVTPSPLRVRGLTLQGNGMVGAFPVEVTKLTELRILDLSGNRLYGAIPPELGRLTELRGLNLGKGDLGERGASLYIYPSDNGVLKGPIPPELGRLTNLLELTLVGIQGGGLIRPELGNLTALKTLDLRNSDLSGPIPSELGNLAALEELSLSYNALDGPIPPELGNLSALKILNLETTRLSGCIPLPADQLTNHPRFEYCDAGNR